MAAPLLIPLSFTTLLLAACSEGNSLKCLHSADAIPAQQPRAAVYNFSQSRAHLTVEP